MHSLSRLPNAPQDAQGRRKVPPTYLPALKALFTGVLCFVGIHLSGMYPVAWMATAEFLNNNTFWYRFGYLQLSCTLQRFMYYFVWTIAEGACIAAGLGYNGRGADGKTIQWCAAGQTFLFRPVMPADGRQLTLVLRRDASKQGPRQQRGYCEG